MLSKSEACLCEMSQRRRAVCLIAIPPTYVGDCCKQRSMNGVSDQCSADLLEARILNSSSYGCHDLWLKQGVVM